MRLERDKFDKMKDEHYILMDWDVKVGMPESLRRRVTKSGLLPTKVKI